MDAYISAYGALLLSGLLGSLGHCLGMCGPLVMMASLQLSARGLAAVPYHLLYHGTRIAIYALLGALAGVVGSLLGLGSQLDSLGSIVSLLLGLGVALVGLGTLGWLPVGRMEGGGDWVSRGMSRAIQQGGFVGLVLLGALNGLLPCGLVYSALLVTASTGGPLPGALGMLIFGAGTIPALLVVGLGAGVLSVAARQRLSRVGGVFIALVGGQLMLRGLAGLGVVSHLRLGDLMLW